MEQLPDPMSHALDAKSAPAPIPAEIAGGEGDPPVVARLVIEIRSDGTRTVARGAMEDVPTGQRALVEARGTTPMSLAAALARSMLASPTLARQAGRAVRALLGHGRSHE